MNDNDHFRGLEGFFPVPGMVERVKESGLELQISAVLFVGNKANAFLALEFPLEFPPARSGHPVIP